MLPLTRVHALDDRRQGRHRVQRAGGVVHVGHVVAHRLVGVPGEVHVAGHGLRHAVEPDAVAVRPAGPVGRGGGEDDVRLDGLEARVVQPHPRQRVRRQIGDHHVCRGHQLAQHFLALGLARIEREAALVAVQRQVRAADAIGVHRRREAILAAVHLLHAHHVRAKIAEQRPAERPGDVAPEIQYANALKNAHGTSLGTSGRAPHAAGFSHRPSPSSARGWRNRGARPAAFRGIGRSPFERC